MKGKFITLEGIEGLGKSTNLEFVSEHLQQRGKTVVTTREPGGTPIGERLRDVLLNSERGSVPDTCELLMMFAARDVHLEQVIRPALERGEWVVCDRFTDATYAYQGGGRGLADAVIESLQTIVQRGFERLSLSRCLSVWELYRRRWRLALVRLAAAVEADSA